MFSKNLLEVQKPRPEHYEGIFASASVVTVTVSSESRSSITAITATWNYDDPYDSRFLASVELQMPCWVQYLTSGGDDMCHPLMDDASLKITLHDTPI